MSSSGRTQRATLSTHRALVISASRRHIDFSSDRKKILTGTTASRSIAVVVGDEVLFRERKGEYFVEAVLPRRNVIQRSYRDETWDLIANVDRLWIVAAVPPLFNTTFIDRLSVVAYSQGIACSLIVNKEDLGIDNCKQLVDAYASIGFEVLLTSAKLGKGLSMLEESLNDPNTNAIALVGVSGVGKSTILNHFVPEAQRHTKEVSKKTGQGRQTTTQAIGFLYERDKAPGLLLMDLPGIQQFGVSHMKIEEVQQSFPDFAEAALRCPFSNCSHIRENECVVKQEVKDGRIMQSRYDSYLGMCQEIEEAKPY